MIRDLWYAIAESREVTRRRPLALRRFGRSLVLWRLADGKLACLEDRCPHRGAALSPGRLVDGQVECFFHGFRFDASGRCRAIPANGADAPIPSAMCATSYEVRESQGFVFLFWGEPRASYPPVPRFAEPNDGFASATIAEDWRAHLSRVVENQLDFTHLPFTHRTTIGRGLPARLDVITEVDGDRIKVKYDPAVWAGAGDFFVELYAPNLWRNRLGARTWVLAAFVPIDDEHTRTYVRFCQDIVTWPGLGWLACWIANLGNRMILGQDRARVVSQRPLRGGLGGDEVLVRSDRPIIEYRRWQERRAGASGEARERPARPPTGEAGGDASETPA